MQMSGIDIGGVRTKGPVMLAPMAGITDVPFRKAVARYGAGMMFSEMVASQEMVQANAATRKRAEATLSACPTGVQIAGREARWMAECARICQDLGAPLIDINMGCPAKKVTSGASGSALMRDLDFAVTLIDAVVAAVTIPVTLKMRLGWDDASRNAPELARRAVGVGVKAITVHGRTRQQFFKDRRIGAAYLRCATRSTSRSWQMATSSTLPARKVPWRGLVRTPSWWGAPRRGALGWSLFFRRS